MNIQCIPSPIRNTYRSGVLRCYDLTVADFPSVEAAHACADAYIAKQKANWTEEMHMCYPDQLFPECPTADLFWFTDDKGMGSDHFIDYCMCGAP